VEVIAGKKASEEQPNNKNIIICKASGISTLLTLIKGLYLKKMKSKMQVNFTPTIQSCRKYESER
jgi:ABC-type molybdate transport system substrate-binding protein